MRRLCRAALTLALVSSAALPSQAQTSNAVKGMIGGGMLGAEAVLLTESALRLRPGWAYLVGGAAGASGGAYLGYELCDGGSNRPPAFLLAGGIALIIPTIMGVLTATRYAPSGPLERDAEADAAGADSAAARLSLPRIELAQTFSREDLARFRVQQVTELHLTFLRGDF
jgi:hypothetical protein